MSAKSYYENLSHDPQDPDPWLTLYLDQSLPIGDEVKALLLKSASSRSRQFLLPLTRPVARLIISLIQVIKIVLPKAFTSSWLLHRLIYFGLKHFVSPEANTLILRHMHVGSEILQFVADNVEQVDMDTAPLKPLDLHAVKDHLFLNHDVNLFNFIIRLNQQLRAKSQEIRPQRSPDFSAITDGDFGIEEMPAGVFNILDAETAIEIYTPLYQLFLTDSDFWRASHSLQLDETIAIYAATVLGAPSYLSLVNNRHPLVPLSTLRSGFRLMLHGLAAEGLHGLLVRCKRAQAAGQPLPLFRAAALETAR